MTSLSTHGQISFEFLMLVGIGLLTVTLFGGVIADKMAETKEQQELLRLDQFARDLRTELILAAEVEDGYERQLELPSTLNDHPYAVTITNGVMVITNDGKTVSEIVPPVTGTFASGLNNITKRGGSITINEP